MIGLRKLINECIVLNRMTHGFNTILTVEWFSGWKKHVEKSGKNKTDLHVKQVKYKKDILLKGILHEMEL